MVISIVMCYNYRWLIVKRFKEFIKIYNRNEDLYGNTDVERNP